MVDNMGTGVGISSLTCSSQVMLIFRFPSAILEFRVRITSGMDDHGTIENSVAEDMVVAVGILFLIRSEPIYLGVNGTNIREPKFILA